MALKRIAIIPNEEKDFDLSATDKIIRLLKEYNAQIFIEKSLNISDDEGITKLCLEEILDKAEMIISLGGDGTLLQSAHYALTRDIPVLGINLGRLGYMTELEINETDMLSKLFKNEYSIEKRMLIDVKVKRGDSIIFSGVALNDIVVSFGHISRMINLSLLCDGRKVTDYKADGLIVCTPTGSTAYSLSAGGPIIEPLLSAITVTPICAHSLASKSIVFSDTSVLQINVPEQRAENIFLTVDGLMNTSVQKGDIIFAQKSMKNISFIKLNNLSFYEILYKKFSESGTLR